MNHRVVSRTYPFADLPANLTAFCSVLRGRHGFRIGPGEAIDAARVLQVIDAGDPRQVRNAWRTILASSRETADAFDAAFDAFFFTNLSATQQPGLTLQPAHEATVEASSWRSSGGGGDAAGEGETVADRPGAAADSEPGSDEAAEAWVPSGYSALSADGTEVVEIRPVNARWRDPARALVRRLELGLSRRWRPTRHNGRRFDLRRTWRASLQTGGEAVTARWLRRHRRRPRIVVLVDGSRSMRSQTSSALDLAVALASAARNVHVFAFSTELVALTRQVRAAAAGRPTRVILSRGAWGGGTNIGDSLQTFVRAHAGRLLGPDTLIVIVSDGLDVGEPARLADTMRRLHRQAAGIVWLNPLAATPGFTPTSRGMRVARPYITRLSSVSDGPALAHLARLVLIRR